jgi:hypothetical protein
MLKPKAKLLFLIYLLLAVGYIVLSFLIPPSSNSYATKYHMTASQVHALSLSIIVPFALIWFVGFYGYDQLRTYASTIRNTKDGASMDLIAKGLLWLGLYLPLSAVLSLGVNYISNFRPGLRPIATVVYNYLILAVLILGFWTLLKGSNTLAKTVKTRPYRLREQLAVLLFLIVSALFTYITLSNPARQFPAVPGGHAAYYMPDAALILTIILPSIFVWYAGFKTAYNIHVYCIDVAGVLYRKALNLLAYGIAFTVTGVMAIRCLT